jgi:hypothetical protein
MWKRAMQRWLTAGALIPAAVMLTEGARAQAPVSGASGPFTLTQLDCQRLAAHLPQDDVTYRAGQDAGIAPADLPNSWGSGGANGGMTTNITLDGSRYGGPSVPGVKSETAVGSVTVDAAGAVTFQGVPLEPAQVQAIYLACRGRR